MCLRAPFVPLALLTLSCATVATPASSQTVAGRAPVDTTRGILSYSDRIAPVLPAVVKVIAKIERAPPRPPKDRDEEWQRRLFGSAEPSTSVIEGTGFVIDSATGLIVTANYLLDDATSVSVQLHDGREVAASIVGRDAVSLIALLHVDVTGLNALRWGDANAARVGDVTFAVGHARPIGKIVTSGIVSGLSRDSEVLKYQDALVSDLAFALGSSGGPMLDSQGQVLGIVIGVCSSRTYTAISCALSAREATRVIDDLRAFGEVKRASLGIQFKGLKSQADEIVIASVSAGSPAARAGLRAGDVIVNADGRSVASLAEMPALLRQLNAGRPVHIVYIREGEEQTVTVVPDKAQQ